MPTRWDRFYKRQLEDEKLKVLVEEELAALRVGAQIAKVREEGKITRP